MARVAGTTTARSRRPSAGSATSAADSPLARKLARKAATKGKSGKYPLWLDMLYLDYAHATALSTLDFTGYYLTDLKVPKLLSAPNVMLSMQCVVRLIT